MHGRATDNIACTYSELRYIADMTTLHFYRYQLPGSKRWKQTRHRMDANSAREWFTQFHPTATYEPVEHGAMDIERPYPGWDGPNNHGGWKTKG